LISRRTFFILAGVAASSPVQASCGGRSSRPLVLPAEPSGLVPLALDRETWEVEIGDTFQPAPRVILRGTLLTIEIDRPVDNNFPRASVWSKTAPTIARNTPYVMEVEARASNATGANIVVGLNKSSVAQGPPSHWFQHWHLNSYRLDGPEGITIVPDGYYYGDWSEQSVASSVPIDTEFHTFRLEYDGHDTLIYSIDGQRVARQIRQHPHVMADSEQQVFRIYLERYPSDAGICAPGDCDAPTYRLQVRRFAVRVGA
jgi:hypothetical protein